MSLKSFWALCALAAAAALAIVPVATPASAAGDAQLAAALGYLDDSAAELGVTSADVADVFVMSRIASKHNGVTHFNFNQRFRGLEVFGGHATVSIDSRGGLVFAGGSLVGLGGAAATADLDAVEAVEAAADELDLAAPSGLRIIDGGAASAEATVSRGGISKAPIPAKLGWQPTKDGLRLAWQVTIDDADSIDLWNAAVDAETGELLDAANWTIEDEHEDLAATLTGGSLPTPPAVVPDARGFSLDPVIDGSSYRVYDLALESPNDGDRRLVQNPADATASPFGWHDTDGVPGPEYTITRGNNTHTFLEQDNDQLPDFGDTDGGPGLDFDFPADLTQHAQAYRDAAVTNEFFGCNSFHDVLYLYGFDENADNFQLMDYGGGPWSNGDYVRCHVASGAGTNNANFSTPSQGGAPRMRMYLWPGNQLGPQNEVVVDGVGGFGAGWARFGPPAMTGGTSGPIADVGNGCVAADYAAMPAGALAIAVGGNAGCQNIEKARAADAAGANAIVLSSGTSDTTILASNSGGMLAASPDIPAVSVSTANGDAIRAALPANGTVRKNPNHPGIRDGDVENGIIWHEYGHGLSNRLTGGPGINCLSGQEQMGEGWSDYVANVAMIDPDLDDPQGPRGMGPYALFQENRQGNGIRPRPYSRDMTIQPATYDSIKQGAWLNGASLAQPHGIGHAWAAALWDMTWDLIDKHGFSGNIYLPWDAGGNNRAMQYMVDGLKLQGCGPTFVTGRAAIIAAANTLAGGAAGDVEGDSCTLWASFSRRGLGYSAGDGGTTSRNDGTEAFDTHPDCRRGLLPPVNQPYGGLNEWDAGETVPLRFTADGYTGLDVLANSGSPFSRRVDCETLAVPSPPGQAAITPRELPIATQMPGNTKLTVNSGGVFHYNWETLEEWAGTCREVVVTRDDGKQHRAFFSFS